MPDTVQEITRLQAEYDKLAAEGAARFGDKARLLLEKQLREELKKRLDAAGGDREAFKARKGEVFHKLHAAKEARRREVVAAVVAGTIAEADGEAEIVAMGWTAAVARADFSQARRSRTEPPALVVVEPPAEPHEEIMDPAGAAQPVAREEKYVDTGKPETPVARPPRRK